MDALPIVKHTSTALRPTDSTELAIRHILATASNHVADNVASGNGLHGAALHQTRIGFRRLRTALALFKPHIDRSAQRTLDQELRRLGGLLSPLRDLDVFMAETLPKIEKDCKKPERKHLDAVRRRVIALRLHTPDMLEDWQSLATALAVVPLRGDDLDTPINEIAPDLLARQARRVKRRCKHLKSAEQRHQLRKAMKRLRYSVEFLKPLYPAKKVDSYLGHCRASQAMLGEMNDAATTAQLCRTLSDGTGDDATRLIARWADRQQRKGEPDLRAIVKEFRAAKPFWR